MIEGFEVLVGSGMYYYGLRAVFSANFMHAQTFSFLEMIIVKQLTASRLVDIRQRFPISKLCPKYIISHNYFASTIFLRSE